MATAISAHHRYLWVCLSVLAGSCSQWVYSMCNRSDMQGRCIEDKAIQATSLAKSMKCESLAFLSSDSVCKIFLFPFSRPGFIPVLCENKQSWPNICRGRIKMEIPFKALGLRHGMPARTWHWDCRHSSRMCWETKGSVPWSCSGPSCTGTQCLQLLGKF